MDNIDPSEFLDKMTKPLKADVPDPIHSDFKKLCVDADTNMKARLLQLIEFDVKNWKRGIDTLKENKPD